MEGALTESDGEIEKFGPCLKGTPIAAEVMKEVGINLVGLSNNHIFDYGIKGYKDTVAALDKAGIAHTGLCRLLRKRKRGLPRRNRQGFYR